MCCVHYTSQWKIYASYMSVLRTDNDGDDDDNNNTVLAPLLLLCHSYSINYFIVDYYPFKVLACA